MATSTAIDQNRVNNDDFSDASHRSDNDDDNSMAQAAAMAATMTMRATNVGDDNDDDRQTRRNNHTTTTAAERAIMGTIDPDENVADFIFQDENGQLVQQRFLQFLNS